MTKGEIQALVAQMTLEEKAGLTSGQNDWFTKAVERLGIPAIRVSDGPHGLRVVAGDADGQSLPATGYPAACATAASFDRALLAELGAALGRESRALGVDVLLGPGVNIKRSPLCGRNFEYFSEDPYLAGELGAAYVRGVQSEGVGVSLKHFFANNQETRRMDVSAEIDERTLREIYLPAFETVVKTAHPWTVMASYNKVGGVYSTANRQALTDWLRREWGFDGLVVSDWGATHDRAGAIAAGCDLTMPAEDTDAEIVAAVRSGALAEADLDACVARVLELVFRCVEHRRAVTPDWDAGHALARKIAANSMVLLKNDGTLPLAEHAKLAFIGPFAEQPRIEGGGSSKVRCIRIAGALQAARSAGLDVTYTPGCDANGSAGPEQLAEAAAAARDADVAVLFIGLPENMESEGVDRVHMRLPDGHNALVKAVCAANPRTVVVLHNGSPVELPWADQPAAILEAYLGGQAVGEATVDVLTGAVNPSGRLPETFPLKLEDNPSYLSFPGEGACARYQEGVFVGYRYYTTKHQAVRYPFGHGLSYTAFAYRDLTLDRAELDEADTLTATVTVQNTGSRAGQAVVQLYVAPDRREIIRPVRELKGFEKVGLQPGESKTVAFSLDRRAFAHWNPYAHGWRCESGGYAVQICENAQTVLLEQRIKLHAQSIPPAGGYTAYVPMRLLADVPAGRAFLDRYVGYLIRGMAALGYIPQQLTAVMDQLPGGLTLDALDAMAKRAGAAGGSAGGVGGLDALLGQPVSTLVSFLPDAGKAELKQLLGELNRTEGGK